MRYPVDPQLKNRSLETISLNGVHLRVDPLTFSMSSSFLYTDQPTAGGSFIRISWMKNPIKYAMTCTTGMGGLPALQALEKHLPVRGGTGKDIPVPFIFPNRFGKQVHLVHINSLVDSMVGATPFNYLFEIVLEEYIGPTPRTRVVAGVSLPIPLLRG